MPDLLPSEFTDSEDRRPLTVTPRRGTCLREKLEEYRIRVGARTLADAARIALERAMGVAEGDGHA